MLENSVAQKTSLFMHLANKAESLGDLIDGLPIQLYVVRVPAALLPAVGLRLYNDITGLVAVSLELRYLFLEVCDQGRQNLDAMVAVLVLVLCLHQAPVEALRLGGAPIHATLGDVLLL